MDPKEPKIDVGVDSTGQEFLIFGSEPSESEKTEISERSEISPETSELTQETAVDLAQVAAKATELAGANPAVEGETTLEVKTDFTEQEIALQAILSEAMEAVKLSEILKSGDNEKIYDTGNMVYPRIAHRISPEAAIQTRIKEIRVGDKFNKKDHGTVGNIASGLYKYRKGHSGLGALGKDKEERKSIADKIFLSLRRDSDPSLRDKLKAHIEDPTTETTFADLFEMYENEQYKMYGARTTHAAESMRAIEDSEAKRDAIRDDET